jgi:hypothetical protein
LPVTWAIVQIYDQEPDHLRQVGDAVATNGSGYFSSGPILNEDPLDGGGLDIVVGIFAASSIAVVIDPGTNSYYYNLTTTVWMNCASGTLDVGNLNVRYDQRGAWWIYSWHYGVARTWSYLYGTVSYPVPTVAIRWPYENESLPHYHPGGEIHLPAWAWSWRDVINHEYAHHVMYSIYGYVPPTLLEHQIEGRSNATTAWAEGWALFLPLVAFNSSIFTWANGTYYANINFENPTWGQDGWDSGDEVEGRVAGALWDIFDSSNDNAPWYYDSFSDGFSRIWNTIRARPCNTSREFWQTWNTSGYPKQPALMAIFQNTIDYRGPGDANGDCIVELMDFNVVSAAYGSTRGAPNWDQRADLNFDGIVEMMDFFIVSANYGNDYDC